MNGIFRKAWAITPPERRMKRSGNPVDTIRPRCRCFRPMRDSVTRRRDQASILSLPICAEITPAQQESVIRLVREFV